MTFTIRTLQPNDRPQWMRCGAAISNSTSRMCPAEVTELTSGAGLLDPEAPILGFCAPQSKTASCSASSTTSSIP